MKRLTEDDVRKLLAEKCGSIGSQSAWAFAHDLSPAYVSDVLAGRRAPGDGMLNALGLERVTIYTHRDKLRALAATEGKS